MVTFFNKKKSDEQTNNHHFPFKFSHILANPHPRLANC